LIISVSVNSPQQVWYLLFAVVVSEDKFDFDTLPVKNNF